MKKKFKNLPWDWIIVGMFVLSLGICIVSNVNYNKALEKQLNSTLVGKNLPVIGIYLNTTGYLSVEKVRTFPVGLGDVIVYGTIHINAPKECIANATVTYDQDNALSIECGNWFWLEPIWIIIRYPGYEISLTGASIDPPNK